MASITQSALASRGVVPVAVNIIMIHQSTISGVWWLVGGMPIRKRILLHHGISAGTATGESLISLRG
jgi:hypothetical protein